MRSSPTLLLLLCSLLTRAFCLAPGLIRRDAPSSRRVPIAQPACCAADDDDVAGPLAGPFWTELCEEAEAEADRLGLEIESVSFLKGTLSVLARGGVDELQALNQALSSFLDTAEGAPLALRRPPRRAGTATQSRSRRRASWPAETALADLPPFMLEVSSPGLSTRLSTELDFISFKGFEVNVVTSEPHKGKTSFSGPSAPPRSHGRPSQLTPKPPPLPPPHTRWNAASPDRYRSCLRRLPRRARR